MRAATLQGLTLTTLAAAALLGALAIPTDSDGALGARLVPLVASAALALLGLTLSLSGDAGRGHGDADEGAPAAPTAVALLLALALGYVWLIGKLGYLLSTAAAAPLAFALFGERRPARLALAALLCPALYHLIFFIGLGVFPPFGDWFDLLDLLRG